MKKVFVLSLVGLSSTFLILTISYFFIESYRFRESEVEAGNYFTKLQHNLISEFKQKNLAEWSYKTSLLRNPKAKKSLIDSRLHFANFIKKTQNELNFFNWKYFKNSSLVSSFAAINKIFVPFISNWDETKAEVQKTILTEDLTRESAYEYMAGFQRNFNFSPTALLESSKHQWIEIHNSLGPKFKNNFTDFVTSFNSLAEVKNYKNALAMFYEEEYEVREPNLFYLMDFTWKSLRKFYVNLHGHVRSFLVDEYDDYLISRTGTIPAHAFSYDGNWGSIWPNISSAKTNHFTIVDEKFGEATRWTQVKLYEEIERSFISMGFPSFNKSFWVNSKLNSSHKKKQSSLEKKQGRVQNASCMSAFFTSGNISEFRLAACENENSSFVDEVRGAFEKVSYLKYMMLAKKQGYYPLQTLGLELLSSAMSKVFGMLISGSDSLGNFLPKLRKPNLQILKSPEMTRGYLMKEALQIIPKLGKLLAFEKWRKSIFENSSFSHPPSSASYSNANVTIDLHWNCHFWNLRNEIEGIKPPVTRNSLDFDPCLQDSLFQPFGASREFLATVIQFHLFRSLCIQANEFSENIREKPLHSCNFSKNETVMRKIRNFMELGGSKPWFLALEDLTGVKDNVDPVGILDYFSPLIDWLKEYNSKFFIPLDWRESPEEYPSCFNY